MKDNEAKDEVAEASAEASREEEEEEEVAEENTGEQTGDEKGGGSSPALAATAESLWVAHDRAVPRRSTTRNLVPFAFCASSLVFFWVSGAVVTH